MQKTMVQLPEIKLVGITTRTNNLSEMNVSTAKIGAVVGKYFQQKVAKQILHPKNPGVTYSIFTDYESDFNGDYTHFIGEEVTSFDDLPEGLSLLSIPAQHYTKFTSENGVMPEVCINMWQKIWNMSSKELGGVRSYIADFEVYDERAQDRQNTVLDIYIGVKLDT